MRACVRVCVCLRLCVYQRVPAPQPHIHTHRRRNSVYKLTNQKISTLYNPRYITDGISSMYHTIHAHTRTHAHAHRFYRFARLELSLVETNANCNRLLLCVHLISVKRVSIMCCSVRPVGHRLFMSGISVNL